MLIENNGLDIPEYLNEDFFFEALQKYLPKSNFKLLKINFTLGSESGNNHCSIIYRVHVTIANEKSQSEQLNLIVKSMPTDGDREIFDDLGLHKKETNMYFDILPSLENLMETKISPKCYHAISSPIKTIVFEDLKASGLSLVSRVKGLDEQHCAIVLKKLGQFHAASMVLAEKNPNIFDEYNTGLYSKDSLKSNIAKVFFLDTFKCMRKFVERWSGYEEISKKLEILEKDYTDKVGDILAPTSNELKVLNHGDLWVNNFLFEYSTDFSQPTDVNFIDFQGSIYTSPGIDINYFLNTSVQLDILENRRDYLLKDYYYESLKTTLEKFQYRNIPSFDVIMHEIERKEYLGLFIAISTALICMDMEAVNQDSIENCSDKDLTEQLTLIACSSKIYQDKLRYTLQRAERLGLLN